MRLETFTHPCPRCGSGAVTLEYDTGQTLVDFYPTHDEGGLRCTRGCGPFTPVEFLKWWEQDVDTWDEREHERQQERREFLQDLKEGP